MSATIELLEAYSTYLVEYVNRDGHVAQRRFDGDNGFAKAKLYYDKCGHADLLGLVKYSGYKFISTK